MGLEKCVQWIFSNTSGQKLNYFSALLLLVFSYYARLNFGQFSMLRQSENRVANSMFCSYYRGKNSVYQGGGRKNCQKNYPKEILFIPCYKPILAVCTRVMMMNSSETNKNTHTIATCRNMFAFFSFLFFCQLRYARLLIFWLANCPPFVHRIQERVVFTELEWRSTSRSANEYGLGAME